MTDSPQALIPAEEPALGRVYTTMRLGNPCPCRGIDLEIHPGGVRCHRGASGCGTDS